MYNSFIETIIIGIVATAIYEMSKKCVLIIYDIVSVKNVQFSVSGFWCSYHQSMSRNSLEEYTAYELMELKYKNGYIRVRLYQLTSDGRKHYYNGNGFLRGDKLAFSYEEVSQESSTQVGTIILRYSNLCEHQVFLVGNYHEFKKNEHSSTNIPYMVKKYHVDRVDKIKYRVLGRRYIFSYMQKENFKNVCEEMSKMW